MRKTTTTNSFMARIDTVLQSKLRPKQAQSEAPQQSSSYKGIDAVHFGYNAADDDHLSDYFVETPEYKSIIEQCTDPNAPRKILVLGRKGSGKSAIYWALDKLLPQTNKSVEVEAASLRDFSTKSAYEDIIQGVRSRQDYSALWQYTFYVMLIKQITGFNNSRTIADRWRHTKSTVNSDYRFLYRYLEDLDGHIPTDLLEIFVSYFRRLRGGRLLGAEFELSEIGIRKSSEPVKLRDLEKRILRTLSPNKQYFILLDELDVVWETEYKNREMLIGLLLAAKHITKITQQMNLNVFLIIFLRDDIYEQLKFTDKNKITTTNTVNLMWDKASLKHLIEKRIKITANGTWDDLFDDELMAKQTTPFDHIYQRTMCRPRDMIAFCTAAQAHAKKLGKAKITKNAIENATLEYSEHIQRELIDENSVSLENHLSVLSNRLDSVTVTADELRSWCPDDDSYYSMLTGLLNASVLGAQMAGGASGGSFMSYRCDTKHWRLSRVLHKKRYHVHPSLKEALGLNLRRK